VSRRLVEYELIYLVENLLLVEHAGMKKSKMFDYDNPEKVNDKQERYDP